MKIKEITNNFYQQMYQKHYILLVLHRRVISNGFIMLFLWLLFLLPAINLQSQIIISMLAHSLLPLMKIIQYQSREIIQTYIQERHSMELNSFASLFLILKKKKYLKWKQATAIIPNWDEWNWKKKWHQINCFRYFWCKILNALFRV